MLLRVLGAFSVSCLVAFPVLANQQFCYWEYIGDRVWYRDTPGGSEAWVMPAYDFRCFGQPGSEEPPYEPEDPGIPVFSDPAIVSITYINDTDIHDIQVTASGDNRMDTFQLFVNGVPYGGASGSGEAVVGGVSAYDFGNNQSTIAVQGCSSTGSFCAFATTSTATFENQRSEFGEVMAGFPDADSPVGVRLENYDRSITAKYLLRAYGVASGPGNSKYVFNDTLAGFTYDHRVDRPTVRSETLVWRVRPQMFFSEECAMSYRYMSGGSLERDGQRTALFGCELPGHIGGDGAFIGRLESIYVHEYEGMNPAAWISPEELRVDVQ